MAIHVGRTLALSAIGGMVAGLAACGGSQSGSSVPGAPSAEPGSAMPAAGAKDCCKGKNECKGKGNCKTDKNDCKGKNECKAKGGCKAADCAGGAAPGAPPAP